MSVREYITALTDLGHPVADYLRPGIAKSTIREFEQDSKLRLPDAIVDLFLLHDGTDFSGDTLLGHGQFIDGFHLMTFSEALEAMEIVDEAIEDSPFVADEPHAFDGRRVLPFLGDGCGDHVVVDIASESDRFGWIGTFLHAGPSRPDEFVSFDSFVGAHLAAVQSGVYQFSDMGFLDASFAELKAVLKRHRQNSGEQEDRG